MSTKPETAPYRRAFDSSSGVEPESLARRREAAFARFEELGFPTRRDEAWRFTDLKPLQRKVFEPAAADLSARPELGAWRFPGETHLLVFVNGSFAPELSRIGDLPKGLFLTGMAATRHDRPDLAEAAFDNTDTAGGQAFSSLNAALFRDGFVLALDDGVKLALPVEILHWGSAPSRAFHLRNLALLGEGAEATLIESYAGEGEYWTNSVSLFQLRGGAVLRHLEIQDESRAAVHFAQVRAEIGAEASYDSFVLTEGAALSRHDRAARFDGMGGECRLNGVYLLRGEQEATTATFVDHASPQCTTSEVIKGVVDEHAHGVFLGRIAVRPHAQKTDAHQLNKNLLLSRRAAVDSKPELEILADDVKCSHGATVGDLDEAALFYLEARGIPALEARRMLIEAFVADALERVGDAALRAHLFAFLRRWQAGGEA